MKYAVIPAFNEEQTIGGIVDGLMSIADKVVVVDDCSKDSTYQVAVSRGAHVIRNIQNCGYEKTLGTGISWAIDDGAQAVLTIDADGQHPLDLVEKMFRLVMSEGYDVAIGYRECLPRLSERIFSSYTDCRYGVKDILSGFKCYSRKVLSSSGVVTSWDSVGSFISIYACKKGFSVTGISIATKERLGKSRFGSNLRQEFVIMNALFHSVWIR